VKQLQKALLNTADQFVDFRLTSEAEILELEAEVQQTHDLLDKIYPREALAELAVDRCHEVEINFKANIEVSQEEFDRLSQGYAKQITDIDKQIATFNELAQIYRDQVVSRQSGVESERPQSEVVNYGAKWSEARLREKTGK
jgi:hypothetical protein